MIILFALLLFSLGANKISCATLPDNSTDVLSLQDFRNEITQDFTGAFKSWNASVSHCMWQGVKCSPMHPGRVVALELPGRNFVGKISPSIGNLTFLHTLNLSANQLSGHIPHLNRLRKMQILDLNTNSLSGTIPHSLTNCTNLKTLDLGNNILTGEIPLKMGLLANLSILMLYSNNLTGTIPPTIGNISHIEIIELSRNDLTGSIPEELGKLSDMWGLALGSNKLSGKPQAIFNLSSLQILGLASNMLDALPHDIGDGLPSLNLLAMGSNMFEGAIPPSLGNASNLEKIDLSQNHFTGQIPSSFGKLANLIFLNLQGNKLKARDNQGWDFLYALRNCSILQTLSLFDNQLEGVIPNFIGELSITLQYLLLGGNSLSGKVPPSIGKLHGLIRLGLAGNQHTGSIEGWIGNLTNLEVLHMEANSFSGPIPPFIGSLTNLTELNASFNYLEGFIPSNLGNLKKLLELDLSNNNLEGTIPKEVLSVSTALISCSLSYNYLEGPIPLDLSNLQQLTYLSLSSNNLIGEIPYSLGQCQQLQTIEMDQNFLTGNIPMSLKNLKSLNKLNLSHNNLSGTVPVTLCDLHFLTKLDISYNNLQGEVPITGVCSNATVLSLAGNSGLCGGAVDLHTPACPVVPPRTKRAYYLIKILIPIFGFMSIILLVFFLVLEKKTSTGYFSVASLGEHFPKVSYKDLAQATKDFSEFNLIGKGSHGTVYRGKLKESKMEVAVKVFHLEMHGAERSFMSECEALRSIQHRNLLQIITACSTVDNQGNVFKALIYEFMPNGNLDAWIHLRGDGEATKCLTLTQRINIATNIADALDYLHHDCGRPTVHCDLKPSNILLDDDLNALLGDFGIARFYLDSLSTSTSTSSIGVKGTIGYIAPEYAGGGRASTFGDVYSFGIVLLEMITGRRPTDPMFKDGLDIVTFVNSNFPHQISQVIDAHLIEECKHVYQENMVSENVVHQCLVSLLQIALSCARPLPNERLNMKKVASKMEAIRTSHLGWNAKKTLH